MSRRQPVPMPEADQQQWETEYAAWCREQEDEDAVNAMLNQLAGEDDER